MATAVGACGAPNILLIPGTSSAQHLRENLPAASLDLLSEAMTVLDQVGNAIAKA